MTSDPGRMSVVFPVEKPATPSDYFPKRGEQQKRFSFATSPGARQLFFPAENPAALDLENRHGKCPAPSGVRGGKIGIENEAGKGAPVWFRLPMNETEDQRV